MTDRLTPAMLRDLATVFEMIGCGRDAEAVRRLAARREAEQIDPVGTASLAASKAQGEREGPGSAAAPKLDPACNEVRRSQGMAYPRTCRSCGLGPCKNLIPEDKPAPAADAAEARRRQRIGPETGKLFEEMFLPASADDLVARLRVPKGNVWWVDPNDRTACRPLTEEAADRIEAQAREIAQWQDAAGKAAVRAEGLEDLYEREKARADKLAALVRRALVTVPLNYVLRGEINNALTTEGGDRG